MVTHYKEMDGLVYKPSPFLIFLLMWSSYVPRSVFVTTFLKQIIKLCVSDLNFYVQKLLQSIK